jgi:carboxypeptidase T
MHRVRRALVPALLGAALLVPSSATTVSASEFPPGYGGFHTYAEMVADITAVQAAHPSIVKTFSIGKSYKGRTIWAAKVSDNVALDEAEPEVMFDGLHHADEHMSLEMTLRVLHWLAAGYGTDARITDIVNGREVWIIFAVNPDGAEYDISAGRFHHWRKNRQPNAGTTAIGTDLNRNYGYRWGTAGTSTNPAARTYQGPSAFSAPETRAVRDFLASRVVGGRQQIRASISFHEFGRLVMWPYGHTKTDVPSDMTRQDRDALAAMGRRMASTNGYLPEQASDLYLTSGTSRDYAYGRFRVFAFTFELSAVDYPTDTKIATETGRNKEAVLFLMERAWCPLSILGTAVREARCGAFDDDLEVARGWARDPDGTDTAPAAGRFARGDQAGTSGGGVTLQPARSSSGRYAYVTGLAAGATLRSADLDGRTTIRSPRIVLPAAAGQQLTFRWFFAHGSDSSAADHLRAIVEGPDGRRTVAWERTGSATLTGGIWRTAAVNMDAWAGQTVRIRFEALDAGASSLVEAGVDDVRVTRPLP